MFVVCCCTLSQKSLRKALLMSWIDVRKDDAEETLVCSKALWYKNVWFRASWMIQGWLGVNKYVKFQDVWPDHCTLEMGNACSISLSVSEPFFTLSRYFCCILIWLWKVVWYPQICTGSNLCILCGGSQPMFLLSDILPSGRNSHYIYVVFLSFSRCSYPHRENRVRLNSETFNSSSEIRSF